MGGNRMWICVIELVLIGAVLFSPCRVAADNSRSMATGVFEIRAQEYFQADTHGMLMVCPAHRYGSPQDARAILVDTLSEYMSQAPSTIWVCRANQLATLGEFAPLVDQVCINPYVRAAEYRDDSDTPIWPRADHPFLNRLREIRRTAPGTRLIACINLGGEPNVFEHRRASFSEIQWLYFAAVGANFQGIARRGAISDVPFTQKLYRLEDRLLQYRDELAACTAVDWALGDSDVPMAMLLSRSERLLFVVLLSPQYLTVDAHGQVMLPLDGGGTSVSVQLQVPEPYVVEGGEYLDGRILQMKSNETSSSTTADLIGSGTILVIHLKRNTDTQVGN